MADTLKQRPEFRNINAVSDLPNYRLPIAGIVSILHRVSGLLMFVLLPFIIWMFDTSVTSEVSFDAFKSVLIAGVGFVPGWFFKLVALAVIWAYLHHWLAGIRHIRMDIKHTVTKEQGKSSAQVVLAISLTLTVLLAAKLFGLY